MGWREVRGVRLGLVDRSGMTASHRVILYALADAADEQSLSCWPSLATLCSWTSLSKSALMRALKDLEAMSLVTRTRRSGDKGSNTSTSYKLAKSLPWHKPLSLGGPSLEPDGAKPLSLSGPSLEPDGATKGPGKGPVPKGPEKDKKEDPRVAEVFEFWTEATGRTSKPGTGAHKKRRACVKARLKAYTLEDIKTAITHCAESAWHVEGGHTDLELITRSDIKLEGFINRHEPTTQAKGGAYDPYRLEKPWERAQREAGHSKPWTPDPDAPFVSMAEYMGYDTDDKEDK